MSTAYQIVVCAGIVPDPLQTLEPVTSPTGPALKNEMMLPAVLDPWAGHALYEAANLAKNQPGSKVWLVSLGPKAKLQQVMMTVAQKVPFELVALDGPASGFTEAAEVAASLAEVIQAIPGLDKSRLLVFGGWESASRGAGTTMQIVGEHRRRFHGVGETAGRTIERDEFERHLLRDGHHHLLELGFRAEADEPDFRAGLVLRQVGGFVKRVARPRIEDGGQHHFIFQRRPCGRGDGFQGLQRIGNDAAADDDLVGCAHV